MHCPICDYENLPGVDQCGDCGWEIGDADVPTPTDALSALLLETPISEIATPDPFCIDTDAPVADALDLMRRHNIRALTVMEEDALVGILTERDLILKLDPWDPGTTRLASDLMTPNPIVVKPEDTLGTAVHRLCVDNVRFLPVVDDQRVVGIVALRDVLHRLVPTLTG